MYEHIDSEPIRRALIKDGFDSDAHADECIRITREAMQIDSRNELLSDSDIRAREQALDDMVQSEIIGESAIKGLREFWT